MSEAQQLDQIVTKADFARIVNVDRSRVTRWIGEGKISGDALVGQGPNARVRVRAAKAQLRRHLDISQRFGNGINTRLNDDGSLSPYVAQAPATSAAGAGSGTPIHLPPVDTLEEQIKRERLATLQRQNRKLAEEEAARAGLFCLAEDARREMGRIAARLMTEFEAMIGDMATELAQATGLSSRDLIHRMRAASRRFRERAAEQMNSEAAALQDLIEHDLDEANLSAAASGGGGNDDEA